MLTDAIYLLPKTDKPSERKEVLLIETPSNCDPIVTNVSSLKSAVNLFIKIRKESPKKKVVLDVGCMTGRQLLSRVTDQLNFKKGYDKNVLLTQLFECLVTGKRKIEPTPGTIASYLSLTERTGDIGGVRQVTENDAVLAEVAVKTAKSDKLTIDLAKKLYSHPIGFIVRFFTKIAKEFQGTQTNFNGKILEKDTLQFIMLLSKMWQAPAFREPLLPWYCFIEGAARHKVSPSRDLAYWSHKASQQLFDFIYSVLESTSRTRKDALERRPVFGRLILTTDRIAEQLRLEFYKVFQLDVYNTRSKRVFYLIDMAVALWHTSIGRPGTAYFNPEWNGMIPLIAKQFEKEFKSTISE